MKRLALIAVLLTFGLSLWPDFADAKRLGGSRSLGMQRSAPVQKSAPAAQPAQAPQQAAKPAAQPAPAQPAPQAAGGNRWLGPIAGLAAGLGLAALASHFGFGEALANGMMIALLVVLGIVVFGWLVRRFMPKPGLATAGGPRDFSMDNRAQTRSRVDVARETWQPVETPAPATPTTTTRMAAPGSTDADTPEDAVADHQTTEVLAEDAATLTLPAGFDADAFVRQAKVNFIRLQAANDEGNLDDLREFTTPEVYAELKLDIDARKGAAQKTEVIDLEAAIVDYAEEANRWVVSVRYSGRLYEDASVVTNELDEVWHLVKPRKGNAGWLVAGIQQLN